MPWPSTLPSLTLTDNFQELPGDGTYRTETDSGPGKTRPRPDPPNDQLHFSQLIDRDQVTVLRDFYARTLMGGSLSFVEFHPRTAESVSLRFVGPPAFPHVAARRYRANFVLEVLP